MKIESVLMLSHAKQNVTLFTAVPERSFNWGSAVLIPLLKERKILCGE